MNFKHLGMYLLVGVTSGGLCAGVTDRSFFPKIINEHIPAVILTVAIVVAVRHVSGIQYRNGWLSPVILTMACLIGWYFAIKFGSKGYDPDWHLVVSGAIGGISVAIGFALAWKISRRGFSITVITVAGTLGGMLLVSIWVTLTEMETLILFVVWQSILLLGICFSVQIDSTKSSVED